MKNATGTILEKSKKLLLPLGVLFLISNNAFASTFACVPGETVSIPIHGVEHFKPSSFSPLAPSGNWRKIEFNFDVAKPIEGLELNYRIGTAANVPPTTKNAIYVQFIDENGAVKGAKYLNYFKRCAENNSNCYESSSPIGGNFGGYYISNADAYTDVSPSFNVSKVIMYFNNYAPQISELKTFRRYSVPGAPYICK